MEGKKGLSYYIDIYNKFILYSAKHLDKKLDCFCQKRFTYVKLVLNGPLMSHYPER